MFAVLKLQQSFEPSRRLVDVDRNEKKLEKTGGTHELQCVFGVTVSGPKTALLARNDDRDARYSSFCGSLRRGKDFAVKSDRKHTSGHIFAFEYVDSYAVSYFADVLRICTWIDDFHSMRNERYRRRLFDERVSRLVRIIKVLLYSVLIPSILYHHLTTAMLIFLQSQLVLSISQRNERGKNPRSRGNSSSFFLPFCSCPRYRPCQRKLCETTTTRRRLVSGLGENVARLQYASLVSRARTRQGNGDRRRRLEILSRSVVDVGNGQRFSFRFDAVVPFSLSFSLLSFSVWPVQAQSELFPRRNQRGELGSAVRKLNINRRQLCFDKIVTRRRHCDGSARRINASISFVSSLSPLVVFSPLFSS